jgi:hypothetical protein
VSQLDAEFNSFMRNKSLDDTFDDVLLYQRSATQRTNNRTGRRQEQVRTTTKDFPYCYAPACPDA